jgi:hypothetical protein
MSHTDVHYRVDNNPPLDPITSHTDVHYRVDNSPPLHPITSHTDAHYRVDNSPPLDPIMSHKDVHYRVDNSPSLGHIMSHTGPVLIVVPCSFKIHFKKSYHLCPKSPNWSLSFTLKYMLCKSRFCTLSIVYILIELLRFGSWIFFRLQVKRKDRTLAIGPPGWHGRGM